MKGLVVTLSVVAMMVLGASDLPADQPIMSSGTFPNVAYVGSCGDFDVYEDLILSFWAKDFFDHNGNWVRTAVRWKVEGTLFNANAPDNFLPVKNSVDTMFADPDGWRVAGLWALVTVPGEGVIFLDAGLVRLDWSNNITFEAGKHQYWHENVDALCGHLAE